MKIVGLAKNSAVDFPGKLAAVIFTPGCNLDCYYCHNRFILAGEGAQKRLPVTEVLAYLRKRQGLLDGVVISGGEPTLQEGLAEFIHQVKNLGYSIKLDTNGSNPDVLREFIAQGLVDYVAMDLKAPFRKYQAICGNNTFLDQIQESITILLRGKVAYEFRTTFVPELTEEDVLEMAVEIRGARLYVLQQYRTPDLPADEKKVQRLLQQPHSPAYLRQTAAKVAGLVRECQTRGI
jgi:pyruvate formate lyase activating enzyme